jgi:hypothetical protein
MNRHAPLRRFAKIAVVAAGLTAGTAFACLCSTGSIKVIKFYDANANGVHDNGEPVLPYWPMTLGAEGSDPTATRTTNSSGAVLWTSLAVGNGYWVREGTPVETNWVQSAPVDANGDPINPQAGLAVEKGAQTTIKFGNYCTTGSGGRTPGFWHNKNGARQLLDEVDGAEEELALLRALNLVNANGLPFDPTTVEQFQTWVNSSNATNMAEKLSSHLAAMRLNREAGFVNGSRTYVPFGGTINELMALANASLASDPFTPSGHPERGYQEQLKDHLDALNNGAPTVLTSPCKRSFQSRA